MSSNLRIRAGILGPALSLTLAMPMWLYSQSPRAERTWPTITTETKPWTRWWWQGSAVDSANLARQLDALSAVGLGGVEITPIYGVHGAEDRFIRYLSPQWVTALQQTLAAAARRKMGVDMATGTGWPFGGPWVGDDETARSLVNKTWTLQGGERLNDPVALRQAPMARSIGVRGLQITDLAQPLSANTNLQTLALEQVKFPRELPLVTLMAYADAGDVIDLTSRVGTDGRLDWTAPPGRWTLYALFDSWHGKIVERAAPGGEGFVIDHFSADALRKYLSQFDQAFAGRRLDGLRAFFNDSYEVDDAAGQGDWTPRFFDEFQARRGYDLRRHLPALLGRATDDTSLRVLADYRETISDLLLDRFTKEWASWAKQRGSQVRDQAHGSPANLLDLYAATDIPETEGEDLPRFKWATSAANVAGRRLVSAEAATWLGEHFRVRLADVRAAVDRFFAAGVNHIVYHGTAYSPANAPWPGWQFYAAVEFNPQNAWWDDFAALNTYVARTQSFLQSGRADSDVLLYYPFYESIARRDPALLAHFGGANDRPRGETFEKIAETLQSRGFTYDYVSDRQLRELRIGRRVLVLPSARFVPLETMQTVLELARNGATVISFEHWPSDVSGLADLDARRTRFKVAVDAVQFGAVDAQGIREATLGRGRVLQGPDIERMLIRAGMQREPMVDMGLAFARRVDQQGRIYFLSNPTSRTIDGWVPLNTRAAALGAFDAMTGRSGRLTVRESEIYKEVYLQIPAGGSLIVAESSTPSRVAFDAYHDAGPAIAVAGAWDLRFTKGGPTLPAAQQLQSLGSWTSLGPDAEAFSGTAVYTTTFARPRGSGRHWALDLGRVAESARVRLNGRDLGTLIGPQYRIVLDSAQLRATNQLEVVVTNLSANRIRDLDRRGVAWKIFYNVNFPSRLPENRGPDGLFTAARWAPLESGLLGPVTLTPLSSALPTRPGG